MNFKNIFFISVLVEIIFTICSCDRQKYEVVLPQKEINSTDSFFSFALVGENDDFVHRYDGKEMIYEVKLTSLPVSTQAYEFLLDNSSETLDKLTKQFNKYKGADLYKLLPSDCYVLPNRIIIASGSTKTDIQIKVNNLPEGNYVLPLCLKHKDKEVGVKFVELVNNPDNILDKSFLDRIPTVGEPRITAIIEATENDLRNVGNYMLEINGRKRSYFDMVVIFSANMNWDDALDKPFLFFNSDIERILNNRDVYITPLQKKGIKVLLSIMPNRQGIGFSNMSIDNNHKMVTDFAKEISDAVKKYQLDGVMFDDEYADYPNTKDAVMPGRGMIQMGSFHYLIKELRNLMPFVVGQKWDDRHNIITFYNLGINSSAMTGERGWCLFSNDFELIKKGQNGWADLKYGKPIAQDRKALREWVKDPLNAGELEEISKIRVGELLDFIWNGNYLRGDDYFKSNEGYKSPSESWIAGLDQESAKKKFGSASFEMSLEANEWEGIKHQRRFWEKADYPEPGRGESRQQTLKNQKTSGETNLMFFNLSYIPSIYNGNIQKNIYLDDLKEMLSYLGTHNAIVTFEGENYDTVIPSYLK